MNKRSPDKRAVQIVEEHEFPKSPSYALHNERNERKRPTSSHNMVKFHETSAKKKVLETSRREEEKQVIYLYIKMPGCRSDQIH